MNTLILCLFLWVNVQIARIGYQQIEHSYSEAIKYSNELEELNKALDHRVLERTEELSRSWMDRVKSLERVATLGSITSSLLHDLKTPLSSIGISLEMLNQEDSKNEKSFMKIELAHEQMLEILQSSEDLMKDKNVKKWFNVDKELDLTIDLIDSILEKNQIQIRKDVKGKVKIYGNPTMFLRVVLNLVINSVEELITTEKASREIKLKASDQEGKAVVIITDNGGGLSQNEIQKVFKKGFGKKHDSKHFGLGLSYVKETVENEFNGRVRIESEKGEFTEVILEI